MAEYNLLQLFHELATKTPYEPPADTGDATAPELYGMRLCILEETSMHATRFVYFPFFIMHLKMTINIHFVLFMQRSRKKTKRKKRAMLVHPTVRSVQCSSILR